MIKDFMSPKFASAICFLFAIIFASYEFYPSIIKSKKTSEYAVELAQVEIENYTPEPEPEELVKNVKLTVGKGDTLASLLSSINISHQEIHQLTQAMRPHYKPRDLRPGQEIELIIEKLDKDDTSVLVQEIRIRPALEHEIIVARQEEGGFACEKCAVNLIKEQRWAEAPIEGSLYETASQFGVPSQVVHNMIRAFSYDIDFQRGLKIGDTFGLMYSVLTDPNTGQSKPGELLYATIMSNGKPYQVYQFKSKDGICGFYNQNGESIRKGLLQTPVDGARLSSGFGKRRHPILGYTKHHKGVDFACPTGTLIMAAGDGVIEQVGRYGAYGNYVRIRHANGYKTAYAHLSSYAKGLKSGKPVKQGTPIGRVGATGRTTGPHLHYEVLKGNSHINPLSVKLIPAAKLQGKQREDFLRTKKSYELQFAKLKETTAFALANAPEKRG